MLSLLDILNLRGKTIVAFVAAMVAVLYIMSAGGCDFGKVEVVKEINEQSYQYGKEELRRGHISEAMSAFMRVVEKRRDAPESHFELGNIYLVHMNDPISAIYHFRKYLELKPNSHDSNTVKGLIDTAKKKLLASMPQSSLDGDIRRMELEELVPKLQRENTELKQRLDEAIKKLDTLQATQRVVVATPTPKPTATSKQTSQTTKATSQQQTVTVKKDIPPTYTVQPGDTLSNISRKVYGTTGRWRDIFKANRDRMATPESLKPGQSLRIPR